MAGSRGRADRRRTGPRCIERQVLQKLHERLPQACEVVLIGIHVIGIDVRDTAITGCKCRKEASDSCRLDDDEIAAAQPSVRTGGSQAAADHKGGIEPALGKHARANVSQFLRPVC